MKEKPQGKSPSANGGSVQRSVMPDEPVNDIWKDPNVKAALKGGRPADDIAQPLPYDSATHAARERLRDEFAAAALTGLLASEATDLTWSEFPFDELPQFVRLAYAFADAALAHRDANPLPATAQAPQP